MHKKSDFFQDVKTTSKEAVFLGHSLYDELSAGGPRSYKMGYRAPMCYKGGYMGPKVIQRELESPKV